MSCLLSMSSEIPIVESSALNTYRAKLKFSHFVSNWMRLMQQGSMVSIYFGARAADLPDFQTGGGGPRRCVSTLTTNGQVGAAIPQNLTEMAFTSVLMVLTVTIFNYVLGEITNVIMAQDAALVATRAQARALKFPS